MSKLWVVFEISINLFQGWMFTYFLRRILNTNLDRHRTTQTLATVATVLSVAIFYSLYIWWEVPVVDTVVFMFTFLYSLYMFSDRWYILLLWNVIIGILLVSTASLTSSLFINFAGVSWSILMEPSLFRLSFVLLSNIILFLVYYIVSKFMLHQEKLSRLALILFIFLLFVALIAMEMQYRLSWHEQVPQRSVLITIFCLLLLMAGLFVLFELLSSITKKQTVLELQIKTSELKETHLNEMRSMYQGIFEFRHDMKQHFSVLEAMIENRRIEESKQYLNRLKSLSLSGSYMTGCISVDALISTKASYMKQLGIEFELTPYPLGSLVLNELEICAIIGNLLDNAIEAVHRIPNNGESKGISLTLSRVRDVFMIKCVNPTDGKPLKAVDRTFISSKRGYSKGYGILSIHRMVDAAQGFCTFEHLDSVFVAEIVLPIIDEKIKTID